VLLGKINIIREFLDPLTKIDLKIMHIFIVIKYYNIIHIGFMSILWLELKYVVYHEFKNIAHFGDLLFYVTNN